MAKTGYQRNVNNHIVDTITPTAIEFHKNYFWFGDNLARVISVSNYPSRVNIGWLSRIANMEGAICSIHLSPADPAKLIENISKSIGELTSKINNGGNALMITRATQQLKDANTLLQKIDQEQENVFFVTISIMIYASDMESLDKKTKRVLSALAGSKMKGRTIIFKQEEALLAASPYGICPQFIKDIGSRNMPSSTVAGSFPFSASNLNDGTGFVFGKDADGGIILLDTWLRGGDRTNSNWTILGVPGVGKSTAVKHIFLNEYSLGTKIIMIDPEREYRDLCKNVGGKIINCGGGKGGRINPLQVKDVPIDDEEDNESDGDYRLYRDEGHGLSPLALHFQTLRIFFRLYLRNIDDIEQAILEEVLEELYSNHGITWSTDTSKLEPSQYPIMKDLYDLLLQKSIDESIDIEKRRLYDRLALRLRSAAIGADSSLWNGHTTIDADSDFIVLDTYDLQEADETIKRTQYFNVLTWAWQQIAKNREEKILLGVEEAYLTVDPEVPQALQYFRNVSKRIRKYYGGLAVITHSVVDFLDDSVRRYGQALLDNPCFKFLMGTDGKNLNELTQLLDLTEAEQELLAKKRRGQGLLIAGSKRVNAKVVVHDFELELFGKGGGK